MHFVIGDVSGERCSRTYHIQYDCRIVFHHVISLIGAVFPLQRTQYGSANQSKIRHSPQARALLRIIHSISLSQLPLIIPITFFIISAFLMVVPCYVAPYEVGMGILITVAGIPVYWFGVLWKDKPKFVQNAIGKNLFIDNLDEIESISELFSIS